MVSVIIPNYCHAPYLRQRIDSVLAQSYPDFEVVLLDDCSTDGSREVIERYRNHPRIKQIVYNDRNGGSAFAQWRKGFALTQGEYIWIAESDDYADPAFLERCVAELDADPACVLAHTLSRTVDSEGRPFGKVRHAGRPVRRMDGRRFVLRHLLRRNELYNASMAVFRRSALPAAGEYEGFRYAGDWYFWMLVALQGRVSTVFEPLNAFRRHDAATTTQGERTGGLYEEVLQILPAIFSRMRTAAPVRWALEGKQLCRLHRARRRFGRNEAYERLWSRWCETYRCDPLRRAWYRIYGALPTACFFNVKMEQFKTSLVISTYNWPEALELCLKSSLRQTVAPAEILVADDGSDERTAQLIARYRVQTSIPIVHVWQEDTGFRVGSIRNKAIARATGAYIIQVDGDVILHPDFVRDHVSVARPGRFVSGSRVLLGPRYSAGLLANRSIDINAGKKDVSNRLNAIRIPWASPVFGRYKPEVTRGCNMAFWRDDAICVNGYNELIQGWGSEDYEFGSRLWHIGVQHFSLKLSGIVYHIYHNVRARDQAVANQVLANLTRSRRLLRCKQGISQYLYPDPETTTLVREVQE